MTENVVGKSDWTNLIETLYRFEGSETKLHNADAERLVREAGRPTSDEDSCEADPAGA